MEKEIEQRSFTRLPYEKEVKWACGPSYLGIATLRNVGRGGMCFRLDRYIAPGRSIQLTFPEIFRGESPVTLRARVAWSKPMPSNPNEFESGAHVVYDSAEALGSVSEIFYAALQPHRDAMAADPRRHQAPGDLLTNPSWAL